jgi:hypothetical protein
MTAPFIEPVTEGNPELASLLLSDTPLTAEQWDYIEACELAAGDDQ